MTTPRSLPAAAIAAAALLTGACSSGSQVERPMGVREAVSAGGSLYALNEVFGRVVRIDPEDGSARTVAVGRRPETLVATADGAWVVTLSREDHTLWAVRTDGMDAIPVEIRPNHNTIAVSPSAASRFVVTYVDLTRLGALDIDGSASLNEVTVVDLQANTPLATSVVVGFNPKQVVFTPDGTRAVVLSESFASIVDLAAPADPVRIPLGANTTSDPVTPETVLVTPDNGQAIVARRASADVFVIELDPPSVNIVDFKIVPTRFVASSDGTTVVAISAFQSTVALFDLATGTVRLAAAEGGITDAAVPPDPADRRVLLWGAGLPAEQAYSLDLDTAQITTIRLVNAPTRIAVGPGGTSVILQRPQPTANGDETTALFDQNESLSILDPEERLITPHFLESQPIDVAFAGDIEGRRLAVVTLRDAGRLAVIDLDTLLIVSRPHLPDVPRSLVPMGPPTVPAPLAVVHDQPWGLVTFLHPDASTEVASGFLLEDSL